MRGKTEEAAATPSSLVTEELRVSVHPRMQEAHIQALNADLQEKCDFKND